MPVFSVSEKLTGHSQAIHTLRVQYKPSCEIFARGDLVGEDLVRAAPDGTESGMSTTFTMDGTASMVALTTPSTMTEDRVSPSNRAHDSELTRRIDSRTFHQVQNLHVWHEAGRVVLRGRSESYYVKQLATHAVLDLMPGVVLENSIDVAR